MPQLSAAMSSITDNVIFISYYKLALHVQDYGIGGKRKLLKVKEAKAGHIHWCIPSSFPKRDSVLPSLVQLHQWVRVWKISLRFAQYLELGQFQLPNIPEPSNEMR